MVKNQTKIRDVPIELDIEFPFRVACVDVGSNAIRFLAAEFLSESEYEVLAGERAPVRLGHGVCLSGRLEASAMDGEVEALTRFRRDMDELEIEHYRAVATSAVREMQLVANVARYHREAHPADHHLGFMALDESERVRVTKLASLLRVADALDREHVQRVTDLTAKLSDDELTLWLDGTPGC